VVCVTRQAALARQPVSASISKETVRYGWPDCVNEKFVRWSAKAADAAFARPARTRQV